MSIVHDLLTELRVPRDCLAVAWSRFFTDLEEAYNAADAPYIAWLLVRIGYDYDEVTNVVRSLYPIPDELKCNPINAYNAVARFLNVTGLPDAVVGAAYRDRYPFDDVAKKLQEVLI